MNKYVDFVSDEDFLECVKHVIDFYLSDEFQEEPMTVLKESKNDIDAIKTIFDVTVKQIGFDGWANKEIERQQDKTINNKIGEFHQELLGKVDGWVNLGIGDETEIDLKKKDNTVFIELKNKHNTMNSSSTKTCREKLENVIAKYPNATAYWAYIISKKYKTEERVWIYKGRENEKIRRISGDLLYEMITGDPDALEKVYEAIPKAIVDILGEDYKLLPYDEKLMKEFQRYIYHDSK
ncbi:MAG: Eco47II family restriction endonuclease [Methanobrevibacter sp.]|nr:Eco47II family restriction endonuclease [Methanobrevibacter sp.]MBQ3298625.1 Eco47II family restriction endonuclease [Bacilli bacterium]